MHRSSVFEMFSERTQRWFGSLRWWKVVMFFRWKCHVPVMRALILGLWGDEKFRCFSLEMSRTGNASVDLVFWDDEKVGCFWLEMSRTGNASVDLGFWDDEKSRCYSLEMSRTGNASVGLGSWDDGKFGLLRLEMSRTGNASVDLGSLRWWKDVMFFAGNVTYR